MPSNSMLNSQARCHLISFPEPSTTPSYNLSSRNLLARRVLTWLILLTLLRWLGRRV